MKQRILLLTLLLAVFSASGLQAQNTPAQALTNVTIHHADGSVSESSDIVWRNGVITAVGKDLSLPFDAFAIDGGDSLHVYPGFIDGYAYWGSPKRPNDLPRLDNPGEAPLDRAGVQPERKPHMLLTEDKNFSAAMKAGFTTAALIPEGYMLPGQVEVFMLDEDNTKERLVSEAIGFGGSFRDAPGRAYPSTLMGVMAKFRQVMYDAEALQQHISYYNENPEMTAPERNAVIESLFPLINGEKPLYFVADSREDIERMFILQDEFGFNAVLVSGKEAWMKAGALKERNIPVLASLDVEDAPKWYKEDDDSDESSEDEKEEDHEGMHDEDHAEEHKAKHGDKTHAEVHAEKALSDEEQNYRDRQLQAWKEQLMNVQLLMESGVKTGYASEGLSTGDLTKKIKLLLDEEALTEDQLLKLMTVNTAEILGVNAGFGKIRKGANASFSVFDKAFTAKKAKVTHSISNGEINEFNQ